ncbi:MAG: glycosyltransferase [Methanobacteriaceae archaeon]|nr:glycosyltransferase [Methanobacteriaceae archaeon]
MISVICVYNDKDILNKCLIKSLKAQTYNYELILVDNTHKFYDSAAKAFNHNAKNANGEYFLFAHQDVYLPSPTFLEDLENILLKLSDLGIAGFAGVSSEIKGLISNMKQGNPPMFPGKYQIKNSLIVQTLDEFIFVIPKKVFKYQKFDEKTCSDWHLYAVDYCLSIKKYGLNTYVLPLKTYHLSPGYSMDENYDKTLKKLLKKHQSNHNWIYTSLGNYSTHCPLFIQRCFKKIFIPILKWFKLWKY